MLTISLKNWLATNAGISTPSIDGEFCFSSTGINYTDPDGVARTGSTGDVLNAFIVAHMVGKDTAIIIAATNYTQLKAINEGNDATIDDVAFAYGNDGNPVTEPKYCSSAAPTPTPTPSVPGLAGTYEFIGPPTGDPSIDLDLVNLEMRQNMSDYHFEMNDMRITSKSAHRIYIALEVRLFVGALTTCPTTGATFVGMDRVSTTKAVRIKILDPGEIMPVNADFYQPASIKGIHTVCLLVHGTWTRVELEAEIAGIMG